MDSITGSKCPETKDFLLKLVSLFLFWEMKATPCEKLPGNWRSRTALCTTPFTEWHNLALNRIERGVGGPGAQRSTFNDSVRVHVLCVYLCVCACICVCVFYFLLPVIRCSSPTAIHLILLEKIVGKRNTSQLWPLGPLEACRQLDPMSWWFLNLLTLFHTMHYSIKQISSWSLLYCSWLTQTQ